MKVRLISLLFIVLHSVNCATESSATVNASTDKDFPPYIRVVLCPMQKQPWECFREQSGRVVDLLDEAYQTKWNEFKDEVNNDISARLQARGFSASEKVREKTASIFEKIETGVAEIKEYAESTANRLLGREEEDGEEDVEYEIEDSIEVDLEDDDAGEEKKKPGGGIKLKKKKKKKPFHGAVAAVDDHDDLAEEWLSGHGGGHGGGHGIKFPHKYGRSLGVTRGKKKKKKKLLMQVVLIGSLIKSKIELLLKLLSAHLQIKFFAISVIGLLLNLARFWIDLKRGQGPQKVIYYEHAHHQHHYDEHDDWDQGGYWRRSNGVSGEYGHEGLDEEAYSRIGRNDYLPSRSSLPSSLSSSSSSTGYLRDRPHRMAYVRQILPSGYTR